MANTYTLISSNVLTGSAASVTFSSIPSTYTDLVLKYSARLQVDGSTTRYPFYVGLNGSSGTAFSEIRIRGNGSAASSLTSTSQPGTPSNAATAELGTANTFASGELYIPNYNSSAYKQIGSFNADENNTTGAFMYAYASLFSSTSAVTSLVCFNASTYTFVSGSSFYLYGIKNS